MRLNTMGDEPSGLTWFLRCADCHKMYAPTEVLLWREGKMDVVWIKPRPVKKPKPCRTRAVSSAGMDMYG